MKVELKTNFPREQELSAQNYCDFLNNAALPHAGILRQLFDNFYEWLDGLTQAEYDNMSLTEKCEKFFFKP